MPWSTFLDLSPDAAIVVDRHGRIFDANAAAHTTFGYPPGALIDRPVHDLLPSHARAAHAGHVAGYFVAPSRRPMGGPTPFYGQRLDGTAFPADVALAPLQHGGEPFAVATIRDRTELARLRTEAASRHRLATAAAVGATFAHDVRTPLMMVLASIELAQEALVAGRAEHVRTALADASEGAAQVEQIAREYMLVARPDSAPEAPADLATIVRGAARLARARLGSTPLRVVSPGPLPVVGSPSRWTQLILTLVDNAARAVSERGSGTVVLRLAADATFARLTVEDTGTGMPEDVRRRCFAPFFSTYLGRGGNGLGLHSCLTMVTEVGGRMELQSELGVGTTVHTWIPRR